MQVRQTLKLAGVSVASIALTILIFLAMRGGISGESWTLYRNGVTDARSRIHVATFNSSDGDKYNRENCETARSLFQNQPSVAVRYWCEQGSFRD